MKFKTGEIIMNELKENIVILSKNIYDLMKQHEKEIDNQIELLKKEYTIFENYFWDSLYKDESYDFKHIEEENLDDYHFRNLVCSVLEKGITDIDYISKKIIEYKNKIEVKDE